MKTFLKMLLATILGVLILMFIGFIVVATFVSMAQQEEELKDNSILYIDLNNVIRERVQENPLAAFNPLSGEPENPLGLDRMLAAIHEAETDDHILGIYLEGGIPLTGGATLNEIRQALLHFRKSGKFVYSFSEIMTQKGYYLASAADSVFMLPEGFFEWGGLSASVVYLKDAMDKLGLEPVVLRATGNKFKSAVEPFLRQDMSAANRLQLTELLASMWGSYVKEVAESRKIDVAKLNQLADSLALTSPQQALRSDLIDRVVYEDEIMAIFLNKTGEEKVEDISFVPIQNYGKKADLGTGGYKDDKIAVIIAQGDIQSGDDGEYSIGSERISAAIRKARVDDKVKAIVLRVNSPGGSAMASEVIWREMQLAQQAKPVVASMGDLAASGGYYISCFADTIVAQPNTITGSIGAFGLFFTGEKLMHDKLGINIETVKTHQYGDLGTFDRPVSPAERKILIRQIDQIYHTFVERVAEGRHMSVSQVDSLGGGRVYSGLTAKELGLVDMIGGLEDAIAVARGMAGIEGEYRVVEYPELEDPLVKLIRQMSGDYQDRMIETQLGEYARYFNILKDAKKKQGLQARMEYDLVIE